MTLGRIERGAVVPRAAMLAALAKALSISVGELVVPVRSLEQVRFRTGTRIRGREQILAEVSKRLDAYSRLEEALKEHCPFEFGNASSFGKDPEQLARGARDAAGLSSEEPVHDVCGLLEENGVKVLLLEKKRDSFFGLSVGKRDGGHAVVVNAWDRIPVEHRIFTAVRELGHLLLHLSEYQRDSTELPVKSEREADVFASEFLMPEAAFTAEWNATRGHPLLLRVLKIKRIFRVGYKSVLYRLVESRRETSDVWRAFQNQYRRRFGKALHKADAPETLGESEFAWNWCCSGEPESLSRHDFIGNRLSRLVRQAVESQHISLGRAAEILGLTREDMRAQARDWSS